MPRSITRILKRTAIVLLSLTLLLCAVTWLYMRQDKFGRTPAGRRLERIQRSAHYREGQFQNEHPTPQLTEGYSTLGVTLDFIFGKKPHRRPEDTIPSMKTDLKRLRPDEHVLIWFGHSSYFIQADGMKILVDPVFSGNASPVPGTNTAFAGTDRYTVDDLPAIDYLFISHDHYDHVDYETLLKLRDKTRLVFCGLGVGADLEYWGYDTARIIERDWNETIVPDSGFTVYTKPARHFSGRTLKGNQTLWMSYVLQTPSLKIYIGGDSGYDTHFADIGREHGPIDLAILEDGQYDIKWKYIHMLPAQVLQAARDLGARRLFPVHSSKFAMANHPWDEPLKEISRLNKTHPIPLVTPVIGEPVRLKDSSQVFRQWWESLR